jgi:hypothetical protein
LIAFILKTTPLVGIATVTEITSPKSPRIPFLFFKQRKHKENGRRPFLIRVDPAKSCEIFGGNVAY